MRFWPKRKQREPRSRVVFRVSTQESSGPSGAGEFLKGQPRNPRRDNVIQIVTPVLGRNYKKDQT